MSNRRFSPKDLIGVALAAGTIGIALLMPTYTTTTLERAEVEQLENGERRYLIHTSGESPLREDVTISKTFQYPDTLSPEAFERVIGHYIGKEVRISFKGISPFAQYKTIASIVEADSIG